jgi:hypothetical protein
MHLVFLRFGIIYRIDSQIDKVTYEASLTQQFIVSGSTFLFYKNGILETVCE